ncbi:hypothetical protein ACIRU8_45315 [Streptomyces sp. NPDC101175]|uniref:hypothetical protein n=1 Tax=Streptomyces sp. NPDC101175 TaxID=3366123 RepID=UPI003835ABFB
MTAEDLYDRYQHAATAHRMHRAACTACTDTGRCPASQRLFESFSRLQDAYLNRQRQQRH